MRRRVVVTGRGVISGAGTSLDGLFDGLMSGACYLRRVRQFGCPGMGDLWGAEIDFSLTPWLPADLDHDGERARCSQLALVASRLAIDEAQLADRTRTGVVVGTTMGEERQIGDYHDPIVRGESGVVDAGFFERVDYHRMAALVARHLGLGGPTWLCAAACSSGNAALAIAYDQIASGAVDAMLAGGADTLTRIVYSGFSRLGALSKGICHPFDRRRDGVCFGEGAGMLVLEALECARARGANIIAELAGYGVSNDAYRMTAPEPSGQGFVRAMLNAFTTSGTNLDSIDYVSAHGTGTPYNDLAETRALKTVLQERAHLIPVSSIKAALGHTNGAASAIEAIACTLMIERQAVLPTANLEEPDPECDLDYVPLQGRSARVRACLNLSAGFGGSNVCVILKGVPGCLS